MYSNLISIVSKRLLGSEDGDFEERLEIDVGYRGSMKDRPLEAIFRDKFSIWFY